MSRWPYAYMSGPQKLSKIEAPDTGRLNRIRLEYQELGLTTPMVPLDSPLVEADYEEVMKDRPPLSPAGRVTVFVDGFGAEIPASRIEGTGITDGASVSRATLDALRKRACV